MKNLVASLILVSLCGCSSYSGITADGASTAYALSKGATELNPLGYATIPLRLSLVSYAKTLPAEQGKPIIQATNSFGWGAAIWNLTFNPIFGIGMAYILWSQDAKEREFYDLCARYKTPEQKCVWIPPK